MAACIILAAGASRRMGESKQLLRIGDESLLRMSIHTACDSGAAPIVVVLGAQAEKHRESIADLPVAVVINEEWEKGMGSSLKKGIDFLSTHHPHYRACLVMVCDQPAVTAQHLVALCHAQATSGKEIIASQYGNSSGVPVLFSRRFESELLMLPDEAGAKKLLHDHAEAVYTIDLPGGETDLDTPEDVKRFREQSTNK